VRPIRPGVSTQRLLIAARRSGSCYYTIMALLMIKCPHTARPISTGIETDEAQLKSLPDVLRTCNCMACGMSHSWWKREAWLADYAGKPITAAPAILRPLRKDTWL